LVIVLQGAIVLAFKFIYDTAIIECRSQLFWAALAGLNYQPLIMTSAIAPSAPEHWLHSFDNWATTILMGITAIAVHVVTATNTEGGLISRHPSSPAGGEF